MGQSNLCLAGPASPTAEEVEHMHAKQPALRQRAADMDPACFVLDHMWQELLADDKRRYRAQALTLALLQPQQFLSPASQSGFCLWFLSVFLRGVCLLDFSLAGRGLAAPLLSFLAVGPALLLFK